MSEYQYYEFAALDRPLNQPQLQTLRALSTRAHITPTSFVNTYQWGNFKGDPQRLVERYFDAFLYLANWGTRELALRFPARLLDPETAQSYCSGDDVSSWTADDHVVVAAISDDEDPEFDRGGEGVLASILPVRSEVFTGDLRALYLLWLLRVQSADAAEDEMEPPVPESLGVLTGSQRALVDFLRIDRDLIETAAAGAPAPADPIDLTQWVSGLPPGERDTLLVALLAGDDPLLRAETLRRAKPAQPDGGSGGRTAGQLRDRAAQRRDERLRRTRERDRARAHETAHRAEAVRQRRLTALAAHGDDAWTRVGDHVAARKPSDYDAAVELLVDLEEVTDPAVFTERLKTLRREHARKTSFVERLDRAGL
ncbi:hypothetical protein [Pseudonocardia parietis]|uniref:Uncharacterized protein n=1 Tax=Pseudonocardia parietis TaxID=570936 RepID=A0ABS4W6N6_9PSEU|nr:hypothetical protein [Pseudonocardia parietis]MBP2371870.1 hypothetical protein [Pseudonocardia parietis]